MVRKTLKLYVCLIPYPDTLNEEVLSGEDTIKDANDYNDFEETRLSLNRNLTPVINALESEPYIVSVSPNPSQDTSLPGLSVYANFTVEHPDNISNSELRDFYKYSIRFSDHENRHPNEVSLDIDVVGMKVKNLKKAAMKVLKSNLNFIQKRIRDFELKKFGEQRTYITDERPDETVSEKLKIAESPFQFRRSAGNWNPRTIGYDFDEIIFKIRDKNKIAVYSDLIDDIMWYINSCRAEYDFCRKIQDCDKEKLLQWLAKKDNGSRDKTIENVKAYISKLKD